LFHRLQTTPELAHDLRRGLRMSGAAGALRHIAPATPLGTMSAQAAISMIASDLPARPRGPSRGDEASGFGDLIASVGSTDGEAGRPLRPTGTSDGQTE